MAIREPLRRILASEIKYRGFLNNRETIKIEIDQILANRELVEIL